MAEKILITPKSFKTYKDKAYALLKEKGYEIIENNLGRTMKEEEIIECAAQGVVGIIIGIDPLPASVLEKCRDLRAISKYGVGMDNIDLQRAKELGIRVKNAVGTNSVSVAELTIGLILSVCRSIPSISSGIKEGGWDRVIGYEVTGKKLGLIGGGLIGREVAKRAKGLEMDVGIYDPYFHDEAFLRKYGIQQYENMGDLFREADIVSLHVPATPETVGIVNRHTLELMKPTAYLINTSRGELVDEEALWEALVNKKIAGAAEDVFSSEPPEKGNKLLALDNFILTPHIGAFTREAVEKMVMVSTRNLLELLD